MSTNWKKRKLPKYLEPRDWNAVLATVDLRTNTGRRDLALYLLMWRTGMRLGETLNLKVKDFNLKTGRIKISAEGKSGERVVYAPIDAPRMRDAIDSWLEVRKEWDPEDESPYFFINKHGSQVSDEQVRQTLARRGRKAGIPEKVTPHMFRHSYATELLREGYSLYEVQDALGHADISTTQIYMHLLPNHLMDIAKRRTEF